MKYVILFIIGFILLLFSLYFVNVADAVGGPGIVYKPPIPSPIQDLQVNKK